VDGAAVKADVGGLKADVGAIKVDVSSRAPLSRRRCQAGAAACSFCSGL
jgi:hypothetical protein